MSSCTHSIALVHANTQRVLSQNVKVICKHKKNSSHRKIVMHVHMYIHTTRCWCCFSQFPSWCREKEENKCKMKRMKSALDFIVANKIHLNVSWTVVAWIWIAFFWSSFSHSLALFCHVYLRISVRRTYYMHISHQCVLHCVIWCASTWPNSTFAHSINFVIFSYVRVVCVCMFVWVRGGEQ